MGARSAMSGRMMGLVKSHDLRCFLSQRGLLTVAWSVMSEGSVSIVRLRSEPLPT